MSDKPLTPEDMQEAMDQFLPLFHIVNQPIKDSGGSIEDTLKVMESVAKLAHKKRADKKEEAFGFLKKDEDGNISTTEGESL